MTKRIFLSRADSVKFEIVTETAELEQLAPAWAKLLQESANPTPMLHPLWVLTWWQHYSRHRTLAVGVFADGDEIIGIAPLCRRTFTYWPDYGPGLPFRRLELMGSSGGERDGACGEYLNVIARAGREEDVARAFAGALKRKAFGAWDECVLETMDGEAVMTAALQVALEETHSRLSSSKTFDAFYLPLPDTWEAYVDSLHTKRRAWMRRKMRNFSAWAGDAGYVVERAHDEASLTRGLSILAELHTCRWQAAGQPGSFASPRFSQFHKDYAGHLLANGQLDLLWLSVGGVPVAAHYSFSQGDKVYFYQSGRRVDVPPHVSLGNAMTIVAIQDAIARGKREFDFLGGDAHYKSMFTPSSRPLIDIRIARPTAREATRWLLQNTRDLVRDVPSSLQNVLAKLGFFDGTKASANSRTQSLALPETGSRAGLNASRSERFLLRTYRVLR